MLEFELRLLTTEELSSREVKSQWNKRLQQEILISHTFTLELVKKDPKSLLILAYERKQRYYVQKLSKAEITELKKKFKGKSLLFLSPLICKFLFYLSWKSHFNNRWMQIKGRKNGSHS